jgi:hypothetical protein
MRSGKCVPVKNWEVHYGVIHKPFICSGSRDSVVGTETRLQAGRPVIRIPVEERDFYIYQNIQTGSEADAASFSLCIGVLSQVQRSQVVT